MPELRRSTRIKSSPSEASPSEPPTKKTKTSNNSEEEEVQELEVGDEIPDITLFNEDDKEINLVELSKKTKYLVIFAYPKASTPGCTRQACGFRDNFETLKNQDTAIYGLSSDLPKAQKTFITKQKLQYSLLSDPEQELIGPLGAKKSPSGIKRSHWIFVDGKLAIKKISVSPEDSFNSAKTDIQELVDNDSEIKEESIGGEPKEESEPIDGEPDEEYDEADAKIDEKVVETDGENKVGNGEVANVKEEADELNDASVDAHEESEVAEEPSVAADGESGDAERKAVAGEEDAVTGGEDSVAGEEE